MDPTKSFDHLDPKLKETYARVMGTDTNGSSSPVQPAAGQPTLTDPALSATPSANTFDPPQPIANPNSLSASPDSTQPANDQGQLSASPFGAAASSMQPAMGPNPGTGPTINTLPTDTTSSMFSAPADATQLTPEQPTQDMSAPATSTFFSNPSPTITDPTQQAIDPTQSVAEPSLSAPIELPAEQTPITPYSPEGIGVTPPSLGIDQMSQPLPSPSSINQAAPHEASALLKVLYIVGAVVFFAIYTIFWIKVFNLPFLF